MIQLPFKCLLSLLSITFLFAINSNAQDSISSVKMPVYLSGSFFYDFPQSFGASAGIEFPISNKVINETYRNGKKKVKYRDLILTSNIGMYNYRYNNSGIYFFQSIGKRSHKEKPFYFEWLIRFGVLRTIYDGQVYSVDNNGNVKILPGFGRYYAVTGLATVFGHDFERSKIPKPFALDIKPSVWVQYPYNSFVLPHFSVEVSFKYHFHSLNMHLKTKQVNHVKN